MEYSWDESKAKKVKDEHAIEFAKIINIFEDPYAVEFIDESHSNKDETRYATLRDYRRDHLRFGISGFYRAAQRRTAFYHGAFGGKLDGERI